MDITPDVKEHPFALGGYAARLGASATGVHDPAYARALVLQDGETKVAIVSIDLCFLPANIKTDVQQRLEAARTELKGIHLFLAATHTHCAPDPLAMHAGNHFTAKGWTAYDAYLRAFTADKIASAIEAADQHLAPAQVGSGVTDTNGLNRNRRHDPIVDPALTVLKVTDTDGHAIAAIVNFAAHPTLYGDRMREVSAEWPGVMEADVEKELGGGVCLFLNGAEGDAAPDGVDKIKGEEEKVSVYGHTVSKAALALLATVAPKPDVPVKVWTQAVTLPARKPNAQFYIAAGQLGLTNKQAEGLVNDLMPVTTSLDFVRVGDLLLIGFPCEPSGVLGLQIKEEARKAGFAHPAVVALVNDWLAYALTPEQYKHGKYEAMMSFYGPEFSPALLAAVHDGLASAQAKTASSTD